jgi:hypothetical protein
MSGSFGASQRKPLMIVLHLARRSANAVGLWLLLENYHALITRNKLLCALNRCGKDIPCSEPDIDIEANHH